MGLFDSIPFFSSSQEAQQVGSAETLTPGQSDLLNNLTGFLSGQVGQGVPGYEGQIAAEASPLQESAFSSVQSLLSPDVPQAAQEALGGLLQGFDPQKTTDFFQSNVEQPTLQTFREDILPAVQERFIGQNLGRSSAANEALAGAGADVSQGLSQQLQQMLFQGEQANRQTQLQAIPQSQAGLQLGLGAGAQQRDILQDVLSGQYQEFQRTQPGANPFLNLLPTALGTKAFEPIVQGPGKKGGLLDPLALFQF